MKCYENFIISRGGEEYKIPDFVQKRKGTDFRKMGLEEIKLYLELMSRDEAQLSFTEVRDIICDHRDQGSGLFNYLTKKEKLKYKVGKGGKLTFDPNGILSILKEGKYGRFKRPTEPPNNLHNTNLQKTRAYLEALEKEGRNLTPPEAAKIIYGRENSSRIYYLVKTGKIHPLEENGKRYIKPKDVLSVIEDGYGQWKKDVRKRTARSEFLGQEEGEIVKKLREFARKGKLLTTMEVANAIYDNTNTTNVYILVREGALRPQKKGKRFYFLPEDVINIIENGKSWKKTKTRAKKSTGKPVTKEFLEVKLNRSRRELEHYVESVEKRIFERVARIEKILSTYIEEVNIYTGSIEDIGKDGYPWVRGPWQTAIRTLSRDELKNMEKSIRRMLGKEPVAKNYEMLVGLSNVLCFLRKNTWKRNQLIENFSEIEKLEEKGMEMYNELLEFTELNPHCSGIKADNVNSRIENMIEKWETMVFRHRIFRTGKSRKREE